MSRCMNSTAQSPVSTLIVIRRQSSEQLIQLARQIRTLARCLAASVARTLKNLIFKIKQVVTARH